MKTTSLFSAALLATVVAAGLDANTRQPNYLPHRTTAVRMADTAATVVVGKLLRVDDVQVAAGGLDAARHRRINDGTWQDGVDGIRREAVLRVSEVLKGDATVGGELRFVSIRQLQFAAYPEALRGGEAVYFLHPRPEDSRNVVLTDERGTISGDAAAGFVRGYLAAGSKGAFIDKLLDAVDLRAGRLSVDACIELSWNHADYAAAMTPEQKQRLSALLRLSKPETPERNELLTAVGRHKPDGCGEVLYEALTGDANWGTTALACNALEESGNRGYAIQRLLSDWETADSEAAKTIIVRSLGLIRPKADYDGPELRTRTLEVVRSQLVSTTPKALLREALIASRDLRAGSAHVSALKSLIDQRAENGLSLAEVHGAIVALAAAREHGFEVAALARTAMLEAKYLADLAAADPELKQYIDAAIEFPWTTLIVGADNRGH